MGMGIMDKWGITCSIPELKMGMIFLTSTLPDYMGTGLDVGFGYPMAAQNAHRLF